jgi:YfiH family protein
MIRPRGSPGIAFGEASDGDVHTDSVARSAVSDALGISNAWAVVDQVHGSTVVHATAAGDLGRADGIITQRRMLPIAVATADCVPVVIIGSRSRAIVHAGWRGVAAGVVPDAVATMRDADDRASVAVIGPCIGPCCYEVGSDVVDAIGGHGSRTTFGSLSVDLGAAIRDQLEGVEVESEGMCTMHDSRFHSYRRDATAQRQMTVAWIPQD